MKLYQKLAAFLTVFFALSCFSFSAFAADFPLVNDQAGLLTEDEVAQLITDAQAVSQEWGEDVVIVTANSLDGKSPMAYADDYFDYNGFGQGDKYSGLVLLIGMDDRKIWISTCGDSIQTFTDFGINSILDDITPYFSDGDYYGGFGKFISLSDKYMEKAATGAPYDVGNQPVDYGKCILIGVVSGLIVALLVCWYHASQLKTKVPQREARAYITGNGLQLTHERDWFLYSRVSKRAKPKDNGGGSSTHSSSSGRSHGGGGRSF